MTAVTAIPMTIAVTTSADGIGSTARAGASATLSARSTIGAVPFVDVADRNDHDVSAGADQRKADDDAQDVAAGQHAPDADQDEQQGPSPARCWKPSPVISAACSCSEPVNYDAELAADLDAEKHRKDRDRARAEESAELAERQDPVVEKSAGENDQPAMPTSTNSTPASRFRDAETSEFDPEFG